MPSYAVLTAFASSGVPSLNVTPSRRGNVYVLASGDTVHFVASHGTILPVLGSWSVSESTRLRSIDRDSIQKFWLGSRLPNRSWLRASLSVPPSWTGPSLLAEDPSLPPHALSAIRAAAASVARAPRRKA